MKERRRYKRFKVDLMEINSRLVLARNVKIINISIGGISLKVDRILNIGSEHTLRIEGKGKALNINCIVIWACLTESTEDSKGNIIPIYTAGMKFRNVSDEKIIEIADFIENLKINKMVDIKSSSGQRLHIRAQIEAPESAVLNYHEIHKVKKLSLGGMLIESKYAVEVDSEFPMKIFFSEEKSVNCMGRIASCFLIKNEEPELYDIGVEFLDMSQQDREILNGFILLLGDINNFSSI
ncbi:MAG: hypothetical protein A2Y97_02070 [Nitrospirae bacterium RBG_13_39_12]|nr:MAG: hypothetical protein A2Y97_02070 [Nitrospirae bacterium RBG_13_39_12]